MYRTICLLIIVNILTYPRPQYGQCSVFYALYFNKATIFSEKKKLKQYLNLVSYLWKMLNLALSCERNLRLEKYTEKQNTCAPLVKLIFPLDCCLTLTLAFSLNFLIGLAEKKVCTSRSRPTRKLIYFMVNLSKVLSNLM